jgi:hypothetical protein
VRAPGDPRHVRGTWAQSRLSDKVHSTAGRNKPGDPFRRRGRPRKAETAGAIANSKSRQPPPRVAPILGPKAPRGRPDRAADKREADANA